MRVELPHYYLQFFIKSKLHSSFARHQQHVIQKYYQLINLQEVTGRELKVNRTLSSSEDHKDTQKVRWFYSLRVDSEYLLPRYTDTVITGVRKQPYKPFRRFITGVMRKMRMQDNDIKFTFPKMAQKAPYQHSQSTALCLLPL